jgi:hypothetical protein
VRAAARGQGRTRAGHPGNAGNAAGERRTESQYADPILMWADQKKPLHRVTLGWGDGDRQWVGFSYA